MAEPTAEASASAQGGSAAGASPHPIHSDVTIRDLLDAGVHFGHQTQRWNPRMKSFLFGERNGVHIIDLDQTLPRMHEALDFVRETAASGGKILFVGTKRQAAAPIQLEAQRAGQYYVNNRWLGGMLTNFKTVKKSIERFKQLLEIVGDEAKAAEFPKKELSRIQRLIDKYRKSLDGIREMGRLPEVVFVVDVSKEEIAVTEARRLGIPIVAVVDSNCSPDGIEYVVPGNDDSIRAIQLYCARVADACLEGMALHEEHLRDQRSEAEDRRPSSDAGARPGGRVVVEITQPPRRGRAASFGRDPDRERPEAPAAVAPPLAPAPAADEA